MTRYGIIENEEFSLIHLRRKITRLRPDWSLTFTAETVEDSVARLSGSDAGIDLLFLDIELDDGNCFDIFRQLALICGSDTASFDIPVIFTTSYDQYAIQAFRLNSIDYLLKPIQSDDLEAAILKWERMRQHLQSATPDINGLLRSVAAMLSPESAQATRPPVSTPSRILLCIGDTYSYVKTADVAYFIAEDKLVYAVMSESGRRRPTNFASLAEVEPMLKPDDFFRLSRAVVANIGAISSVEKYLKGRLLVTLNDGISELKVTVTSARRQEFLAWYGRG